ncbi:hypothetical protein ADJ76_07455 [Schaalia meyeri]|nr:hypothetical protein ADJ76_07455 [Schaalia meyeri]
MEDVSDLLGAVVGDFDADMCLICREGCAESFLLTLREPITRGAQEIADLVEGIACASAVAQCVLLDAPAYLIKGIASELDDVKGVQHAGGVLELVINGVLISLEGIQCRDSHSRAEVFSALGQPVLVHGARPSRDQVQQAGRGMILPACQVHDAGEFTWATTASVLVVPYVLIDPQYLNPCETGRIIRCGLQTRLDMGPHGIPCGS